MSERSALSRVLRLGGARTANVAPSPDALLDRQTPDAPFNRILVANRGEIAVRVLRTIRELGCVGVAIYSDMDRTALHVRYCDEAWCIGGAHPAESYLDIDAVLRAARAARVDAIHPGYGFLAENAAFARACTEAGIVFIGPSPEAIDQMGSKTTARQLMLDAGVPVVPGTATPLSDLDAVRTAAADVGYPVAIKARAGGGGKGFRVALTESDVAHAFEGAVREGERYFGDGAVYVERYLHDPRHVEVQILADRHGNVVSLGERDCTIQRRHQKLVEEGPAPTIDDRQRQMLADIAIAAARAVDYQGAGTVECLLDADGTPYFLEMNTRIQVEHSVTEMLTGIDIVAEQIRIASGEPLRLSQSGISTVGHAIECRINAENAAADFRPSSGYISAWRQPAGPGVRVDAGYESGSTVPIDYDTLLAKLVVHAHDRPAAIARMRRALAEFAIEGVDTLLDAHRTLIASEEFERADSCRDLIAHYGEPSTPVPAPTAAALQASPRRVAGSSVVAEVDGRRFDVTVFDADSGVPVAPPVRPRRAIGGAGGGDVSAPIPGNVVRVLVAERQPVRAGDIVCILEAMKMENEIAAPVDGVVESVSVAEGDTVGAGELLLVVAEG